MLMSQPNTTQVPNRIIDYYMRLLSDTGFKVLIIIVRQTLGWIEDPLTKRRKDKDWISYSQLMLKSGRQKAAISLALRELESHKLIEILDSKGNNLRTREDRRGKKLFYRLLTSSETEQVKSNMFGNRTSETEHTKETNTKTLSKDNGDKKVSCPLLNGSPLTGKYPNGHKECIEYMLDIEEGRGRPFTNKGKQFLFLHKLLRANIGFSDLDKVIAKIEKRYGKYQWDFATISNWVDKGA